MLNLSAWDWVLLVIGVFVAWSSLARLMRQHRDQVLQQLTEEAAAEQQRQRLARQLEQQRKSKTAKQKAA
jgi:predicted tellurium resistance membrane protein TerC